MRGGPLREGRLPLLPAYVIVKPASCDGTCAMGAGGVSARKDIVRRDNRGGSAPPATRSDERKGRVLPSRSGSVREEGNDRDDEEREEGDETPAGGS